MNLKKLNIIDNKNKCFIFSSVIILIGILFIIINSVSGRGAFNYDVVFSGGTAFQVDLKQDFNNNDIAEIVTNVTSQTAPQIQRIVGTNQVLIKIKSIDSEMRASLIGEFALKYGITKDDISYQDVSATVSNEMQRTALLAIAVSCIAMLIYVSIRFKDFRIGSSAILALLHDALIIISAYAILRIPLNYSFIAAVLTILGYSINSTIVMFDRVRENRNKNRRMGSKELVDMSVNQTLRRSIFTSLTSLLSIICLYAMGVPSIKEFSLPIIIGIVFGAYSSVFLAGSFWYILTEGSGK